MKLPISLSDYKPKKKSFDKALIDLMGKICLDSPHGYQQMTKQLQHEGWSINHKKSEFEFLL